MVPSSNAVVILALRSPQSLMNLLLPLGALRFRHSIPFVAVAVHRVDRLNQPFAQRHKDEERVRRAEPRPGPS